MSESRPVDRQVHAVVLAVAVVSVSHAAIFVRLADAEPLVIAAYRMLVAAAVLSPLALATARSDLSRLSAREWRLIAGGAVFLALHFATWTASLQTTSIANSVVLVTLIPVWLAVWSVLVLRRPPGPRMWAAIACAVTGSAVMGWGSARIGLDTLVGDGLALAGGFFFTGFLLFAQAARRTVGLLAFVTPVYTGAAVLLWIPVLALSLPVAGYSGQTYLALVALGLVSQILGHTGFNWAVREVSPMVLALLLLLEPLLSVGFGWIYFGEGFGLETAVGGTLVLAAIYLGARASANRALPQTG